MDIDERETPVVLIVEDEQDLADLYGNWLDDSYEVWTAYDGDEATEKVDETVDVVLLDRRLPGMSGDEFLAHIRENDYDCQVAMVSAVDPDFEIIEMEFDDYVVKPVDRAQLRTVVERMLCLDSAAYETQVYFAQTAKRDALQGEKSDQELAESAEYAELLRSIEAFERRVLSLAEEYLVSPSSQHTVDEAPIYRQGIKEWKQRRQGLDENDPLYRAATDAIQQYETFLDETKESLAGEQELLEIVAEGFVADGFWLDSRLRRALNEMFFDKINDDLIIERKRLEPGADLSPEKQFEVSHAVRQKAASRLASLS